MMQDDENFSEILGKNLVAARTANQMTQLELANAASISRATIADIESGKSDPRLSTIASLARVLKTMPMMLLLEKSSLQSFQGVSAAIDKIQTPQDFSERMEAAAARGTQQGAKEGIRSLGVGGSAGVGAAIGSTLFPGLGTLIGAALGGLIGEFVAKQIVTTETEKTGKDSPEP